MLLLEKTFFLLMLLVTPLNLLNCLLQL